MGTILVTGDPICDHDYYKGKRPQADTGGERGFRWYRAGGGAFLLRDLIASVMEGTGWNVEFGLHDDFVTLPPKYHAFCLWEPQLGRLTDDAKDEVEFWRAVDPPLGYGHLGAESWKDDKIEYRADAYSPIPGNTTESPEIVVIDDAGIGFRDSTRKKLWSSFKRQEGQRCPRWVVLKLTGPLGANPLLDEITAHCSDNLVVVVPAEELRRRAVRLGRGLSWEATAEDLTLELQQNPLLTSLLKARHLIVTFQSDGAFWLNNEADCANSLLVFDASRAEGEWSETQGRGSAFGYLTCVTASIVRELCRPDGEAKKLDLESALAAGLGASRELRRLGHGQVVIDEKEPEPGFPKEKLVEKIRRPVEESRFVSALVPQAQGFASKGNSWSGRRRGHWMMLDEWQVKAGAHNSQRRAYFDVATAVAILGPDALERFPVARFGSYLTVDRKEIESLRTIRHLINNYRREERPKTPLSLGVFGPPGSGKSYIVIQIAKEVLGIDDEDVLLFNLSQFSDVPALLGAFHQVRDKVLSGVTPLVFWDEFDSEKYKWLQYMLAPMEDGEFQEGQITHKIGKCIFVFAGATSAKYDNFGPPNPAANSDYAGNDPASEELWRDFVLKKGPDFKSRLVGYLNVLGVNPRVEYKETAGRWRWEDDPNDLCYPIRRAFFIRTLFKLKKGEKLELDPSVLRALLEIPKYKSGGRSLQFLCAHLQQNAGRKPGRSHLPGVELLNMHVDADQFWQLCEQDAYLIPLANNLAPLLHEAFRLRIRGKPKKVDQDVEFKKLSEDLQLSNIGQALRIPSILRLADMRLEAGPIIQLDELVSARCPEEEPIRHKLSESVTQELLAEAEHNGWMVERMLHGWKYGRVRDDDEKLHPDLIPYSQLTEEIKNYDRWTIVGCPAPDGKPNEEQFGYVDIVKTVGLRVVAGPEEAAK